MKHFIFILTTLVCIPGLAKEKIVEKKPNVVGKVTQFIDTVINTDREARPLVLEHRAAESQWLDNQWPLGNDFGPDIFTNPNNKVNLCTSTAVYQKLNDEYQAENSEFESSTGDSVYYVSRLNSDPDNIQGIVRTCIDYARSSTCHANVLELQRVMREDIKKNKHLTSGKESDDIQVSITFGNAGMSSGATSKEDFCDTYIKKKQRAEGYARMQKTEGKLDALGVTNRTHGDYMKSVLELDAKSNERQILRIETAAAGDK